MIKLFIQGVETRTHAWRRYSEDVIEVNILFSKEGIGETGIILMAKGETIEVNGEPYRVIAVRCDGIQQNMIYFEIIAMRESAIND